LFSTSERQWPKAGIGQYGITYEVKWKRLIRNEKEVEIKSNE
jgi:hypothetical protein